MNEKYFDLVMLTDEERSKYEEIGREMARFKNELGFPPDMFLSKLEFDQEKHKYIVHYYCEAMMEHKRASGAQDKALDRTRKHNRVLMERVLAGEELGEY